jgi:hypothetical protein
MKRLSIQRWSAILLLVIATMAGFAVRTIGIPSRAPAERIVEVPEQETAVAFYDALNAALSGGGDDTLSA